MAFVADGTPIPAVKADGEFYDAEEANSVRSALLDLRTAANAGTAPVLTAFGASDAFWTKGTGADAPRHYIDRGRVHLLGSLIATAGVFSGAVFPAAALPVGRRPAANRSVSAAIFSNNAGDLLSVGVTVTAGGGILAAYSDGAPITEGDILFLDGVSFLSEA